MMTTARHIYMYNSSSNSYQILLILCKYRQVRLLFPSNDFGHANIEIEEDRGLVTQGHLSQPGVRSKFFVRCRKSGVIKCQR